MGENAKEKKNVAVDILLYVCALFLPFCAAYIISVLLGWCLLIVLLSFLLLAFAGVGELIAGIAIVGIGIEKIFAVPMGAVAIMGFGVCNIGVALLVECFVFWIYGIAIPAIVKKIFRREVSDEKKA